MISLNGVPGDLKRSYRNVLRIRSMERHSSLNRREMMACLEGLQVCIKASGRRLARSVTGTKSTSCDGRGKSLRYTSANIKATGTASFTETSAVTLPKLPSRKVRLLL